MFFIGKFFLIVYAELHFTEVTSHKNQTLKQILWKCPVAISSIEF